jgi:hypothetical protein
MRSIAPHSALFVSCIVMQPTRQFADTDLIHSAPTTPITRPAECDGSLLDAGEFKEMKRHNLSKHSKISSSKLKGGREPEAAKLSPALLRKVLEQELKMACSRANEIALSAPVPEASSRLLAA